MAKRCLQTVLCLFTTLILVVILSTKSYHAAELKLFFKSASLSSHYHVGDEIPQLIFAYSADMIHGNSDIDSEIQKIFFVVLNVQRACILVCSKISQTIIGKCSGSHVRFDHMVSTERQNELPLHPYCFPSYRIKQIVEPLGKDCCTQSIRVSLIAGLGPKISLSW